MPWNVHISRFFRIFVGREGRVNGLTNKAFNDKKREDYGDIYVLLHVVIRHLPCHLHGNCFHLEGDSEDADIPGPWNTALTTKRPSHGLCNGSFDDGAVRGLLPDKVLYGTMNQDIMGACLPALATPGVVSVE